MSRHSPLIMVIGAAALGFLGVYGFTTPDMNNSWAASLAVSATAGECNIKGNVSSSGERIYHVPGQRYYEATSISLSRGEHWFCSTAEARAAGWRAARV